MSLFPSFILGLPQAEVPLPGIVARLLQAQNSQVVFFEISKGMTIPPHSHGEQWGMVVSGELNLTIDGAARLYRAGDSYHIGAGVVHSAQSVTAVEAVDFFADPDRYRAKGS